MNRDNSLLLKQVTTAGAALIGFLLLYGGTALAATDAAGNEVAAKASLGMTLAFYIIGGLTVMGAVATITRRNPVVAAVCLVMTLCASAGLYVLLHATFLAAMQVLVYAGAIMVLFIIVIMAVERPEEEETGILINPASKAVGVLAVLFLFWRVIAVVRGPEIKGAVAVADSFGDVRHLGKLFFNEYLLPFEAISVLLLTAIVGAVVVSRRRRQSGEA